MDLRPAKRRGSTGITAALILGGAVLGLVAGLVLFGEGVSGRPVLSGTEPGSSSSSPSLYATLSLPSDGTVDEAPLPGSLAPGFSLARLGGGDVSLSELRGRAVLINFWASWCPPCRLEMPDLVRAYERYEAQGLTILAVNLTFQDAMQDVEAFVEEFHMTFPVLLDERGEVAAGLYRLRGLPTSVFVEPSGIIRRIYIGAMSAEQIDEFVKEILP